MRSQSSLSLLLSFPLCILLSVCFSANNFLRTWVRCSLWFDGMWKKMERGWTPRSPRSEPFRAGHSFMQHGLIKNTAFFFFKQGILLKRKIFQGTHYELLRCVSSRSHTQWQTHTPHILTYFPKQRLDSQRERKWESDFFQMEQWNYLTGFAVLLLSSLLQFCLYLPSLSLPPSHSSPLSLFLSISTSFSLSVWNSPMF